MISANLVTMRYGKRILFEKVSVKYREGNRYGLIGANGSGKSTFMKILAGQLESSAGTVVIDQGCTMGFLKQDHSEYDNVTILDTVYQGHEKLWNVYQEREILYSKADLSPEEDEAIGTIEERFDAQGGYTMEADAAKLLIGLGFPAENHEDLMSTLQGGWKLRVLLAQVLFAHPDILLLDEPTNHLDMASRDWLEQTLMQYRGTVIVISHDRYFLNQVCTHISDLDYEKIRMFTGNYDDFMITNQSLLEKHRRETATKEKRVAELKDFINRFSANASKARQATSRQKELEKIDMEGMKPSSRVSPYLRFEPMQRLGDKVFNTDGLSKSYDETLFQDISLTIGNDEKVAILGPNGGGKTTFIKCLMKLIEPDHGSVVLGDTVQLSYFPQDAMDQLTPGHTALEWLTPFAPDDKDLQETEIRKVMGRMLFKGDDAHKPVEVLSGGEKARLIVCRMLLEGGNVLVFDEPTNHLDLESIESLNYALSLFPETVIFVSHDREFVSSLATRIIEIHDGQLTDYPGNLKDFYAWKADQTRKAKKLAKAN